MLNDTHNIQNKASVKSTSSRRRFLQTAGLVAPVVLTFSSPTVFGGNAVCLSQQLSGTASHQNLICNKGSHKPDTIPVPFTVGSVIETEKFSDYFAGGSIKSLGTLLSESRTSTEAHFIAALLNASEPGNNYILTVVQVQKLYAGDYSAAIPNPVTFLVNTW
jgi:hypothetical protein